MSPEEFLAEFEDADFPSEYGPWISRERHDPKFTLKELDSMRRQGLIEIRRRTGTPVRFRFTLRASELRKLLEKGS